MGVPGKNRPKSHSVFADQNKRYYLVPVLILMGFDVRPS